MSSVAPAARSSRATIRVLIADDHTLVRTAIRRLLETRPELSVVDEATDGEEAIARIKQSAPDVALIDLLMPRVDGLSVIRRITESKSATRLLALTAHDDAQYIRDSLMAGAAGFLPKDCVAADLFAAIETVAAGQRYIHPRNIDGVLNLRPKRASLALDLSERESEVLKRVALGYSNKEIAEHLGVSVKTVETFKSRAMQKLGAKSRVDIVRTAIDRGWFASSLGLMPQGRRECANAI